MGVQLKMCGSSLTVEYDPPKVETGWQQPITTPYNEYTSRRSEMIIYGVWNCLTCSLDYYKTKQSAKARAKQYLLDCVAEFNLTNEQEIEVFKRLDEEGSAYYEKDFYGEQHTMELVSIDEIEVLE